MYVDGSGNRRFWRFLRFPNNLYILKFILIYGIDILCILCSNKYVRMIIDSAMTYKVYVHSFIANEATFLFI